jgi:hypothetical protein
MEIRGENEDVQNKETISGIKEYVRIGNIVIISLFVPSNTSNILLTSK